MSTSLFLVLMVIIAALFFDFTNGFRDSANAMATAVATGAVEPKWAVLIAAVLNVAGAFFLHGSRQDDLGWDRERRPGDPTMIFAGLVGAILWNLVTWLLGLPSSSSHALIGAVSIGAGCPG